jgi:hypothetical protein
MAEQDPIRLPVDAVLVPRDVLDTIAVALASILRVSGEGLNVLIDRLDIHDGDPDLEDDDPAEHDGTDQGDQAWIEWHTQHPGTRSQCQTGGHEDHEEDDAPEEDDDSGQCTEDEVSYLSGPSMWGNGPGCPISDPGGDEHDGREREQLLHDVPMLPVVSAEHNIFNDKRTPLGLSNLQSSFRTNGQGVRSADSGNTLMTNAHTPLEPGVPV